MTLWKWSQTASSNATADSTIGWAEQMHPGNVNDSARAMMAATAKYRDDLAGTKPSNAVISAGGSANALTLTSNQSLTALTNGFMITFRVTTTNTATATLAVDSLTAKTIQAYSGTDLIGGEMIAGQTVTVTYFATVDKWLLHNANVPIFGTYTPTITGSTGAPSVTYLKQHGRYMKIGRMVFVDTNVHLSSKSGGSGDINLSLPFARYSNGDDSISLGKCYLNAIDLTGTANVMVACQFAASFCTILGDQAPTVGTFQVPLSAFDGTDGVAFSLAYPTTS